MQSILERPVTSYMHRLFVILLGSLYVEGWLSEGIVPDRSDIFPRMLGLSLMQRLLMLKDNGHLPKERIDVWSI